MKYDPLNEPQYSPIVIVKILHKNCGHVAEETLEEYNELPHYEAVPDRENTYYSRYLHWCPHCLEQGKHLNSNRYYIAPDTQYDSNLYNVFDSQKCNKFGEHRCVLTYVPQTIAQAECDRLNKSEGE